MTKKTDEIREWLLQQDLVVDGLYTENRVVRLLGQWLQSQREGEVICKCGHPANRHCIAECCHTGAKSEPHRLVCDCECFTPNPPQGEEGYDITTLWMNAEKKLRESLERESTLTAELTALRSQLSEAQAWKESMLAVTPDMQKIGKLLNVKLGESVHDKIIPGIEKLQQEVAEAQENYEKVWDAAVESHWYDTIKGKGGVKLTTTPPPEDKTTFINKIKKGKE
jgi:hypothetical protein